MPLVSSAGGWTVQLEAFDFDLLTDVFDGGDLFPRTVGDGLAARVEAGAVVVEGHGLGPAKDVGGLLGQHAATLFLVEKEDGVRGEVFMSSGGDGCGCIAATEFFRLDADFLSGKDLGVELAVGEDEEAPSLADEELALAEPGVGGFFRRWGEPVAGEGEGAVEDGHGGVAGIVVAVEAEELGGFGCCGCVGLFCDGPEAAETARATAEQECGHACK